MSYYKSINTQSDFLALYNCKKTFINTLDEVEDFLGLHLLANLLNGLPQLTFGFKMSPI